MKEIEEGNKLILGFMGWYCLNEYARHAPSGIIEHYKESRYHRDWTLLMVVVEKIESLGFKFIIGGSDRVLVYNKDYDWRNGHTTDSLIECVWHGSVEFIKWYNQQAK